MAIRNVLDSDVDQITAFAIRGVNAFIALYEDERGTEERVQKPRPAAGPVRKPAAKPDAKSAPRAARPAGRRSRK